MAKKTFQFKMNEINMSVVLREEGDKTIKKNLDHINFIRKSIKIQYHYKSVAGPVLTNELFDHFHVLELQQLFKHEVSVEHLVIFRVTQKILELYKRNLPDYTLAATVFQFYFWKL